MIDYVDDPYASWAIHDFIQEYGRRTLCRSH